MYSNEKSKPLRLPFYLWPEQSLQSNPSHFIPIIKQRTTTGSRFERITQSKGGHPEANTVFRWPAHPEEGLKAHLKEEVTKGEAQFKKMPFASTVIKNITNRKIADQDLETMPHVTV